MNENKESQNIRILVFDVWGDFAHFRRFYTTTSPLSFPIPPRTALCGLIGAIIGKEKENNAYLNYFTLGYAKIGLKLLKPIKTTVIAENLIHTKNSKGVGMNLIKANGGRSQINFEFLKDQKYRIYFHHIDEELYNNLKRNLINHHSIYTPCLGLSENIANFKFIGEVEAQSNESENFINIESIVPSEMIESKGINFEQGEYFSIKVPIELNTERIPTKYSDILFEKNGKELKVKLKSLYWSLNYDDKSENIVFIE
ncbi:MAG: type I-B CRISPR-associated protein Cas5b [Methanosarcinaceae archaeon]|jgi:CRISPR-associated protein Cas5h|nr:type I-B CRISPR-associated protein Cas5b [Methanosarcinaceae archaeon]NKQ38922.1 type I-B CRISPR-associated protein Cas5 [Methanosarcinales archaeon]